ncbi:winged helix DNA-binding protein [Fusibacter sp. JL216-2]|uniref:winged helix DNA-binding protein n=1 Tax=Fusibacter sp. JL216-2 TaxID=3071453 RepID=UPI003D325485
MNNKERAVLNVIQEGMPISKRPFQDIGRQIDMSESQVIEVIESLNEKGLIRRFGGIVNIAELGVVSTLVGLRVQPEDVEKVALEINTLTGVTHNYERDDAFNLWFTLMESSDEKLHERLEAVEAMEAVECLIDLKAKQKFKTKVVLDL